MFWEGDYTHYVELWRFKFQQVRSDYNPPPPHCANLAQKRVAAYKQVIVNLAISILRCIYG